MSTHVQLVFLMDGFNAACKDRAYVSLAERVANNDLHTRHSDTHNGYIGIVSNMAAYAFALEAALDEYILANYFDNVVYPGVFEYEVTEELGTWLFNNPDAFTEEVSQAFIDRAKAMVAAWFNPCRKAHNLREHHEST